MESDKVADTVLINNENMAPIFASGRQGPNHPNTDQPVIEKNDNKHIFERQRDVLRDIGNNSNRPLLTSEGLETGHHNPGVWDTARTKLLREIEKKSTRSTVTCKDNEEVGHLKALRDIENHSVRPLVTSQELKEAGYTNVFERIYRDPRYAEFAHIKPHRFDYSDRNFTEVYEYLGYLENFSRVPRNFMGFQVQINYKHRHKLIDWLMQVIRRFEIHQETLFICVQLLDRYLADVTVEVDTLQLLGVTCLILAAKFQETKQLPIHFYADITDNSVAVDQILQKEVDVLRVIEHDFSPPTILQFLLRLISLCKIPDMPQNLSLYFSELCLLDANISSYRPSLVAASCLYLAVTVLELDCYYESIEISSGYTRTAMMEPMAYIPKIISRCREFHLLSVYSKYSRRSYLNASGLRQLRSDNFRSFSYFSS